MELFENTVTIKKTHITNGLKHQFTSSVKVLILIIQPTHFNSYNQILNVLNLILWIVITLFRLDV